MTTALDIIKGARRLLNVDAVGETIEAAESQEALDTLNYMLDSWNTERLNLFCVREIYGNIVAAKNPVTIGIDATASPVPDFYVTRPLKIERAFVRTVPADSGASSDNIDYQMSQIDSLRYAEISMKSSASSYPSCYWYDAQYPVANLYLWPVPSANLELHLYVWSDLDALAALTTTITLPPGYENALRYNLAVELAPMFGKKVGRGEFIYDKAAELKRGLKMVNQEQRSSTIDPVIVGNNRSFQIYRGY